VRNDDDDRIAYAKAWMNDPSMLVTQFRRSRVLPEDVDLYRWYVEVITGIGELDGACSGEDVGPPVCKDRAPTKGYVLHHIG
jgi:hypothetical protein